MQRIHERLKNASIDAACAPTEEHVATVVAPESPTSGRRASAGVENPQVAADVFPLRWHTYQQRSVTEYRGNDRRSGGSRSRLACDDVTRQCDTIVRNTVEARLATAAPPTSTVVRLEASEMRMQCGFRLHRRRIAVDAGGIRS
jgi:hypothetical protein